MIFRRQGVKELPRSLARYKSKAPILLFVKPIIKVLVEWIKPKWSPVDLIVPRKAACVWVCGVCVCVCVCVRARARACVHPCVFNEISIIPLPKIQCIYESRKGVANGSKTG